MKEETKKTIQTVSLSLVVVGSIGAIATGLSPVDVSAGVEIASSIVILVSSLIAFIFRK